MPSMDGCSAIVASHSRTRPKFRTHVLTVPSGSAVVVWYAGPGEARPSIPLHLLAMNVNHPPVGIQSKTFVVPHLTPWPPHGQPQPTANAYCSRPTDKYRARVDIRSSSALQPPRAAQLRSAQRSIEAQSHLTWHAGVMCCLQARPAGCLSAHQREGCSESTWVHVGLLFFAAASGGDRADLRCTQRAEIQVSVYLKTVIASLVGGFGWKQGPRCRHPSSTRSSLVPKRVHDVVWALPHNPARAPVLGRAGSY